MSDVRNNILVPSDGGSGDSDCQIHSHAECNVSECEIHRTLNLLSEGQIKVTILGGICSLIVSTVFALAGLTLWCIMTWQGRVVPPFPWWIVAAIGAPYGGAFVLKIAPKIPWQVGKNDGDS